jgi:hypothetical protein
MAYQLPPDKVMSVVRLVLVEQGLPPRDVGVNVVETEVSTQSSSGRTHAVSETTRFIASALELDGKTQLSIVEVTGRSVSDATGGSTRNESRRAFALEAPAPQGVQAQDGASATQDVLLVSTTRSTSTEPLLGATWMTLGAADSVSVAGAAPREQSSRTHRKLEPLTQPVCTAVLGAPLAQTKTLPGAPVLRARTQTDQLPAMRGSTSNST